jgi:RAB protein geranylgeranyltransferase component A
MNFQKELLIKQVSIQEKMLALQEKERVDKFPSWVRDYYVIEQKEIAARRLQAGQPSGEK